MVTKLIMLAAIPFDTSQLQGLNKNVEMNEKGAEKIGRKEKEPTVKKRSYTKRTKLSPAEKLQFRREKNRNTAQASRIKAKNEESLLKQRLIHLEYETMKLLLENEALRSQSKELEEENKNLKFKTQNLCEGSIVEENNVEAAFKHAWFVNIPLQKEWVLLRIFFTLIIFMWKIMRQNVMILNYWMLYVNKQLKWNRNLKQKFNLICLPWSLMMHLSAYLHIPKIPDG